MSGSQVRKLAVVTESSADSRSVRQDRGRSQAGGRGEPHAALRNHGVPG